MLTLGLETSGMQGMVALRRDGVLLCERALPIGRRHAQTLVADIHQLLNDAGTSPRNCDQVAISLGPGSFTGLRVGIVFAKTFAYATGCRLIGVETMSAIAERCPPEVGEVQVVIDAQRQELFVGKFVRDASGSWTRNCPVVIEPMTTWQGRLSPKSVVTGPGLEKFASMQSPSPLLSCHVLEPELWQPTAAIVAAIGERKARLGESTDPWTLEPLYLRKSAAEEKWDASRT